MPERFTPEKGLTNNSPSIDLYPGLSAFPKIMPKGEAAFTPQYIINDNSLFTVAASKKGAELFGRLGVTPGYEEALYLYKI